MTNSERLLSDSGRHQALIGERSSGYIVGFQRLVQASPASEVWQDTSHLSVLTSLEEARQLAQETLARLDQHT